MAKSMRAFNLILGFLLILLGILSFVFSTTAFWVILIVVSIGMLILGIAIIVEAFSDEDVNETAKLLAVIFGVILIIFSMIIIIGLLIDHETAAQMFLILLGIDLIILGVFRIIGGVTADEYPTWFRAFSVIIGALMIVFAILIFITPISGAIFLIIYIGIVLIVAGVLRLITAFVPE